MYLAVDIGGTKTLVASMSKSGEITKSSKFPTPRDYEHFWKSLTGHLKVSRKAFLGVSLPRLVKLIESMAV